MATHLPPAEDLASPMAPRGKGWLRLTAVVATVLSAWLIAAEVGFVFIKDDPPPWNLDLRVWLRPVPSERNGCRFIDIAAAKLLLPPKGPDRDRMSAIERGDEWDEAFVTGILQQNQKAAALYDQAMAMPDFGMESLPLNPLALHKHVRPWFELGHLGDLRCLLFYRTGHREEAIAEAMKMVEFGRRIEDAGGDTATSGAGWILMEEGLAMLLYVTLSSPIAPGQLERLVQELADCEVSPGILADAARTQYGMACRVIDVMAYGNLKGAVEPAETKRYQGPASLYTFLPNRTKNMLAQACRACIDTASQTYAESRPMQELYTAERDSCEKDAPVLWGIPSRNWAGREVFIGLAPAIDLLAEAKCQTNVMVRGTRLLLAIRCFEMARQRLPERLEELVPEYLDLVPLDDFDGRALRWSKEKRIVYSVGANLVDDGGDETKIDRYGHRDIVLHLDQHYPKKPAQDPSEKK